MTKSVTGSDPIIVMRGVEKQYGGLRPLRVRTLEIAAPGLTTLLGFDRPAAETFINLVTGASLPDVGDVSSLGRPTRDIADSDDWLAFVERFGIVSDRVVLLDAMTAAQNLALSFDLDVDPVPPHVLDQVKQLAAQSGIAAEALETPLADASPLLQAKVRLGRALALAPQVLILEHPTATLEPADIKTYADLVKETARHAGRAVVLLTADERFARNTNGRLLVWQPATGEFVERSSRKFWPFS
jgi:predicted ABC-type transport system involved in lysophospholipase L1 biosynthesis ATPase subunit